MVDCYIVINEFEPPVKQLHWVLDKNPRERSQSTASYGLNSTTFGFFVTMALAINNPRRLIYHYKKNPPPKSKKQKTKIK